MSSADGRHQTRLSGALFALRAGVHSVTSKQDGLSLVAWPHAQSFGHLGEAEKALLRRFAEGRVEVEVDAFVLRLAEGGWLTITVSNAYTLEPRRPPPEPPLGPREDLVLSRFALIRRDGAGLVVESPRAWCDVRIHDASALAALYDLEKASARMREDLHWAGIAVPRASEEAELRSRQWSPHELWFHERSRLGDRGGHAGDTFGATFWAKGIFEPLPARPPPFPGATIDLHRPDLDALRTTDPTLSEVLEARRSIHSRAPIDVRQLAEFLYRCARTRRLWDLDGVEHTSRPYPSGGALYELELYPVVGEVSGLAPGMYHYDSHEHRLRSVREPSHPAVRRLLRVAGAATPDGAPPSLLLVVSARVGRVMWKYEAMAYALILKHVGVLYQTMYAVATAMKLAPCALGSGDSAAFNEATGRDPLVECGVGEFVLGARVQCD